MTRRRFLKMTWTLGMLVLAVMLLLVVFSGWKAKDIDPTWMFVSMLLLAFFAEYVDSSLGMGYGTTITPVLLIVGYSPLQVVPLVLMSEFISGTMAGVLHHRLGNVDFGRGQRARTIVIVLGLCSVIGTVLAVLLAINLPKDVVKLYIGVMILAVGIYLLLSRHAARRFSWGKIVTLGSVAAFNKGISGGGYGPLVTGGQILSGVSGKNAVGVTSLVEGGVCFVGLILYLALNGMPEWALGVPILIGSVLSVPAATVTVRVIPESFLGKWIGYATIFLGLLTLVKCF